MNTTLAAGHMRRTVKGMHLVRRAFTLPELALASALLAVLTAFAIPALGGPKQAKDDRDAQISAQAALDAVITAASVSGERVVTPAALAPFLTGTELVPGNLDAPNSATASVGAAGAQVAAASRSQGGCWMLVRNFAATGTDPVEHHLFQPDDASPCTAQVALELVQDVDQPASSWAQMYTVP